MRSLFQLSTGEQDDLDALDQNEGRSKLSVIKKKKEFSDD